MTVLKSRYAVVVVVITSSLVAFLGAVLVVGMRGRMPVWAWLAVVGGWLISVVRAAYLKLAITSDQIRVVNMFRTTVIARRDLVGVESGWLPATGEPVLVLVTPTRRVRVTASLAATPAARAAVVDRITDLDASTGSATAFSSDRALRAVLSRPIGVGLGGFASGLVLGLVAGVGWFGAIIAASIAAVTVGVAARMMSHRLSAPGPTDAPR